MALGNLPLSMSDIADELGESLPISMRDAESMWLAGVASGAVDMSDFEGKLSVVEVDSDSGDTGTSHSYSVNFGAAVTGRRIVVLTFQFGGSAGSSISNMSIGGVTGTGNDNGSFDGSGGLAGAGIFIANPSGTSGTVSFNTGTSTTTAVVVLAILTATTLHNRDNSTAQSATGGTVSINIPSDGICIGAFAKRATGAISWTNLSERGESAAPVAGYRYGWAADTHMSTQTGRSVSASSSGSNVVALEVQSFT